jgi:2-methylcitrate dehydratase PrpD
VNMDRLVAEFAVSTRWEDLPAPVQDMARWCLLDSLGATLAGTLSRVSRIAAEFAVRSWPGQEATILLAGKRAGTAGAAFANACAANALDIDDCGLYTKGHPGAQLFPVALAVAEELDLDGARMLAAMVVGYEVALRAGRCWHDHHSTYQACGSWGSVACASVASNLLGLTIEQARHALGIAEYHAPNAPMMRDIDHPAMVKHAIGWGAMTGITAAKLAHLGFTGIPTTLSFEKYRDWVADIGRNYLMVNGIAWKRFASCAWNHAALNAAEALVKAHAIRPSEIAHVLVEGFHETFRLGINLPTSTEEAQFSLAWPLAAFLIDGELGPAQMLEDRFDDEQVRMLANKIEVVESEELSELADLHHRGDPQGKYVSVVTVTMADGRVFRSGMIESGINFPQMDWDGRRLEAKFRWLAGYVVDRARTDALVDTIWRFEEMKSVRQLTALLQGG